MNKVFITRDLKETDFFKISLEKVGFSVFGQSLIHISNVNFDEILPCTRGDWIFFYSKNGVKFFIEKVGTQALEQYKIATIGESTANLLYDNYQVKADFIGTGEPLQTAKAFANKAAGKKVLFPRAKHSRTSIQQQLGNTIIAKDLIVYENQPVAHFDEVEADILVFTSPMNARTFFGQSVLKKHQKIIAIGNTTAKALKSLGVEDFVIAKEPSEKGLAAAVLEQ